MICNHTGRISTALKFALLYSVSTLAAALAVLKRLLGINWQSSEVVSISLLLLGAGLFHQHIPKSKS